MNPSFERLLSLLSQMQTELALRQWEGDCIDRSHQAMKLHAEMWAAIEAYRDHYSPITKVAS